MDIPKITTFLMFNDEAEEQVYLKIVKLLQW